VLVECRTTVSVGTDDSQDRTVSSPYTQNGDAMWQDTLNEASTVFHHSQLLHVMVVFISSALNEHLSVPPWDTVHTNSTPVCASWGYCTHQLNTCLCLLGILYTPIQHLSVPPGYTVHTNSTPVCASWGYCTHQLNTCLCLLGILYTPTPTPVCASWGYCTHQLNTCLCLLGILYAPTLFRHRDQLLRMQTEIKHHPNSVNRKDGIFLSR
jgi:hypothetical protein